jgi:hypothetical protein
MQGVALGSITKGGSSFESRLAPVSPRTHGDMRTLAALRRTITMMCGMNPITPPSIHRVVVGIQGEMQR